MLEDTIPSSPIKSDKSIHEIRLLRRTKRKKTEVNAGEKDAVDFHTILNYFYHDSEEESIVIGSSCSDSTFVITNPSPFISNYKPFELEKSLVKADHMFNENRQCKTKLPGSQGFVSCQRLAENDATKEETNLSTDLRSRRSSFTITESELIICCHQAEQMFHNATLKKGELSPTKQLGKSNETKEDDLFLVNSILEDFSQSPLTKEQMTTHTPLQYTPEFRLRKLPVKTYSRKFLNRTPINFSSRFKNQSPVYSDEDTNSTCSSLSIQEDVDVIKTVSSPQMSLSDTSQHLCENLLNLSVYFTQNDPFVQNIHITRNIEQNTCITEHTKEKNSNEPYSVTKRLDKLAPEENIPRLIEEILSLRANCKTLSDSYNSLEDFCGFSSFKDNNKDVAVTENKFIKTVNNPCDTNNSSNQPQSMSVILEDEDSLDNWNDDNCEEIFACCKSEEISQKQNKDVIAEENKTLKNEIFEDTISFNEIGFKTAPSKPIKVSKEAHIMAGKILSKLPDIPTRQEKTTLNNFDTQALIEDYEWNDDCDLFVNFQTPKVLEDKLVPEPHQSSVSVVLPHQYKHQLSNESNHPSTSKVCNIGFKTASGKNVHISRKAQESVQQFLDEFNKELDYMYDCDDLKEMKNKVFGKRHYSKTEINVNKKSTTEESKKMVEETNCVCKVMKNEIVRNECCMQKMDQNMGFQTANGKNIIISTIAQQTAKNLLNNFNIESKLNLDVDLLDLKYQINKKNIEQRQLNTKSKSLTGALKQNQSNVQDISPFYNGFITAKGKQIDISADAQKRVEKLLHEFIHDNQEESLVHVINRNKYLGIPVDNDVHEKGFCRNNPDFENIILSEWPLSKHTENLISNTIQHNLKEQETLEVSITLDSDLNKNLGFQMANGKKVSISSEAQQVNEKQDTNNYLAARKIEDNFKEIKTNIGNKNKLLKNANCSIESIPSQEDQNNINTILIENSLLNNNNKTLEDIPAKLDNLSMNKGFQMANDKAVQKLLKEFNTNIDIETNENNFKEFKMNAQNGNKPQSFSQDALSPTNDVQSNITSQVMKVKRKYSIDNSDIPSPGCCVSPPRKIQNKGLLHPIKLSFVEQSLKSPLTRAANSMRSKKHLLSLTKRHKNKINSMLNINENISEVNKEQYEEDLNIVTPIKSIDSLMASEKTPTTPNFTEFLSNAPLTSTPRIAAKFSKSHQTIKDSDFEPITWNETSLNKSLSNSNRTTKLSETSSSNITINSSNPTTKERIGRLKMYGKAPAVSPILIDTHNNCRPSGLRRTRSMFKKTEK